MITANEFFKMNWPNYKQMVIIPAMMKRHLPITEDTEGIDGKPLCAYVNHGRWVVKCECGGAEKAWNEGYFMCQSCFNTFHGHKYRLSIFPEHRGQIEKLLIDRPLVNRNWKVGETLGQLLAENKNHETELLRVN